MGDDEIERLRAALARAEERHRLLARATTDATYEYDLALDRGRWSESMTSTFGWGNDLPTDWAWWRARVHPDDVEGTSERWRGVAEDPGVEVFTSDYRFRCADGRYVDVTTRAFFVRDEAGRAVRLFGAMLDVTEKRRLQERLRVSERLGALGTFAAGIAHEVKNPLAATTGNLALARGALHELPIGRAAIERFDAMLADAEEGARRVRAIVDGLATFNRASAAPENELDLRDVVELALRLAGPDLKRRATLDVELADVPTIVGNRQQLGQVLLNLLSNAHHALEGAPPTESRVRIALRPVERHVELSVADNGVGICSDDLPRLFEPFFTTRRADAGTGLGLAICREIVVAHGGTIEAAPVEPRGAVFRVRLPVAAL